MTTVRVSPSSLVQALRLVVVIVISWATVLIVPDLASAQSRRARLSEDLAERLGRGDLDGGRVIVTATQDRVDAIAARHGLRVRK